MIIDRIELKQIGLPRGMQRTMAGEAEAKVQAKAKMVMSAMEAEANNKLVEAGDSLDVVSVHLRYLQTMMRINGPQNHNHGFIIPFPLEMLRLKQSIGQSGLTTLINIVRNKELMIPPTKSQNDSLDVKTSIRRRRKKKNYSTYNKQQIK